MRKKIFAFISVLTMATLTACGSDSDADVAQLTQTGTVADYSEYIEIGSYTGLSIETPSADATDEEIQKYIDDALAVYNYLYVEDGNNPVDWSDDVARILSGGEYTTVASYQKYLKESYLSQAKEQADKAYIDGIWAAIIENSTFTGIDENEITEKAEAYYASQKETYEYYATYYSYDYDTYMQEKQGMTDEEFHENCYTIALAEKERIIASSVIFYKEGLSLSDSEFSRRVAALSEKYGYDSSEEFLEGYGEEYVREVLVSNIVDEYLIKKNKQVTK